MILNIWLTEVPEKTTLFIRLTLVNLLLDGAGYTAYTANLATGRIKKYSIILSSINFLSFPLTWIVYYYGGVVQSPYYLLIITNVFYHIARMFLTEENVGLSVRRFVKDVYWPVLKTATFAFIPSVIIVQAMTYSYIRFFISLAVGVIMSIVAALFVGMTKKERTFIIEKAVANLTIYNKNR